jgi:hypothetical protein
MTLPTQQLVLSRIARGRYLLEDSGTPVELRMSGWRARGEAIIGHDVYRLQRTGLLDRGVSAVGPTGDQVVRLARKSTFVPPLLDCTWKIRSRLRGYEATLHSPHVGSIAFGLGYRGRSGVTAQIVGSWPQRDLIVLAGAFAVLLRRRDDTEAGASVATTAAIVS